MVVHRAGTVMVAYLRDEAENSPAQRPALRAAGGALR